MNVRKLVKRLTYNPEARWWGIVGLASLLHIIILLVNFNRTPVTFGYDWPGHFTYLYHVADNWQPPQPEITPQFFNPPLYYFCIAIWQRLIGIDLARAGQVFNLLLAFIALILLVSLCRRLWGKNLFPSLWFVGFYVLNPTVYRAIGMIRPEVMLLPLFLAAGWLVIGQLSWSKRAVLSGLLAGLAFGIRQWGVFLEGGLALWLVLQLLANSTMTLRQKVALVGLQGATFLAVAAVFLSWRGGDALAFNVVPQPFDISFLTHLELPTLFTNPVRPALNYRFWPVLYADFWGDVWRYWVEALGRDPMPSSPATIQRLARAMVAALPASGMIVIGFWLNPGKLSYTEAQKQRMSSFFLFTRALLVISLFGYLIFASLYAGSDKGDTVKSIYLVYLVPYVGWLASAAAARLAHQWPDREWLLLLPFLLLVVFIAPNSVYQPPTSWAARIWEMPPIKQSIETTFGDAYKLMGYEIVSEDSSLIITLIWRADAYTGKMYKVFVHLLDSQGQVISQSDAIPANWQRPTQGWMLGEFIIDVHTLTAVDFSSSSRLEVGFYDEASGKRLLTDEGLDHVILEHWEQ